MVLGAMAGHVCGASTKDSGHPTGLQVPYSAGRKLPSIEIPEYACDAHHHIYDPVRFPYVPEDVRNQPPATVDAYRLVQKKLGTRRNVIVQPSAYGTNNRCTLDALQQMGGDARGVVVIDESISEAQLESMHKLGVRGIRFNIATGASNDRSSIQRLAERVHAFGWHVQFWMSAKETVAMEAFLQQLPNRLVFDHRGHLPQPDGIGHPAYAVICGLVDQGKAWVKLSGLYIDTNQGEPNYSDTVSVGNSFVAHAPERVVWGTDWPHPSVFSERRPWPDDANMLDLLAVQAPDPAIRHKILVENPEELYGFGKASA